MGRYIPASVRRLRARGPGAYADGECRKTHRDVSLRSNWGRGMKREHWAYVTIMIVIAGAGLFWPGSGVLASYHTGAWAGAFGASFRWGAAVAAWYFFMKYGFVNVAPVIVAGLATLWFLGWLVGSEHCLLIPAWDQFCRR